MIILLLVLAVPASASYCSSGPSYSGDSNLGPVTLIGSNNTSIHEYHDCPGTVGVIDYTGSVAPVYLIQGVRYSLTYQVTTCGGSYDVLSTAWIDYNINQIFEDNENLQTTPSRSKGLVTINFTVPNTNIVFGTTRIRVQVQETSSTQIYPCNSFGYGGTKDFSIKLLQSGNNPVTPTPTPTATPRPPGGYCYSGPLSTDLSNLGAISLSGDSGSSLIESSNCPGAIGPIDFTYLSPVILTQGQKYYLYYSVTSCGSSFPTAVSSAWIDYNQNSYFDYWESLSSTVSSASQRVTVSFTVPMNSPVREGLTRLRIQVQQSSSTELDPCSMFTYGGTKDFTVKIVTTVITPAPAPGPASSSSGSKNIFTVLGPVGIGIIFSLIILFFYRSKVIAWCQNNCHLPHRFREQQQGEGLEGESGNPHHTYNPPSGLEFKHGGGGGGGGSGGGAKGLELGGELGSGSLHQPLTSGIISSDSYPIEGGGGEVSSDSYLEQQRPPPINPYRAQEVRESRQFEGYEGQIEGQQRGEGR